MEEPFKLAMSSSAQNCKKAKNINYKNYKSGLKTKKTTIKRSSRNVNSSGGGGEKGKKHYIGIQDSPRQSQQTT